jgi:hypothetical protein
MRCAGDMLSFTTAPSNLEEDKALGLKVVALINTYLRQNESSCSSATSLSSQPRRW